MNTKNETATVPGSNEMNKRNGVSVLKKGTKLNLLFKSLANERLVSTCWSLADKRIKGFHRAATMPACPLNVVEIQESGLPVYAWFDKTNGNICYYTRAAVIEMNLHSDFTFHSLRSLTDLSGLTDWECQNVEDMCDIFYDCSSLKDLSCLAKWRTGNVFYMNDSFQYCRSLTDLSPLSDWNVGNVVTMSRLFSKCSSLKDLSPLSKWNVGNVKYMCQMFSECDSLTNLNGLENWDTSNVMDMSYMCDYCESLKNADVLENWNVNKVGAMCCAFPSECSTLPNWYKECDE